MSDTHNVMICSCCYHWEQCDSDVSEKWRKHFGRCKASPHSVDVTEWDDDGDRVLLPHHAIGIAFVLDGSGYYAELITAPNHG